MPLHKDLTGADLHEPKGVAGASLNTVYHANGSGSGTWKKAAAADVTVLDSAGHLASTNVEAALAEVYEAPVTLQGLMADVASADAILVPVPFSGELLSIDFILASAITTADSVLTVTRSDGAAMGTAVIAYSGSTEGSLFTFTPTGNETFVYPTHRYVKIVSDAGATGPAQLHVIVKFRRA